MKVEFLCLLSSGGKHGLGEDLFEAVGNAVKVLHPVPHFVHQLKWPNQAFNGWKDIQKNRSSMWNFVVNLQSVNHDWGTLKWIKSKVLKVKCKKCFIMFKQTMSQFCEEYSYRLSLKIRTASESCWTVLCTIATNKAKPISNQKATKGAIVFIVLSNIHPRGCSSSQTKNESYVPGCCWVFFWGGLLFLYDIILCWLVVQWEAGDLYRDEKVGI